MSTASATPSTGTAWYRKHFSVPPEALSGKVYVEFDRIRQGAEFFINGASLGHHEDGITATSLGYATLPLQAHEGRVVRIQLVGKTSVPFRILGDERLPVEKVVLENIFIDQATQPAGEQRNVEDLTENNLRVIRTIEG